MNERAGGLCEANGPCRLQSADAFTTTGDSERARVYAEAETNFRQALLSAGIGN